MIGLAAPLVLLFQLVLPLIFICRKRLREGHFLRLDRRSSVSDKYSNNKYINSPIHNHVQYLMTAYFLTGESACKYYLLAFAFPAAVVESLVGTSTLLLLFLAILLLAAASDGPHIRGCWVTGDRR